MQNKISFPDLESFIKACVYFVCQNVAFEADAQRLTIEITGY